MNIIARISSTVLLAASSALGSPSLEQLHGAQWGSSSLEIQQHTKAHCASIESRDIETPSLPLAREHESYLIAHKLEVGTDEIIEQVVYTFADDQLVMISARGGAIETLIDDPRSLSLRIGDWRIGDDFSIVMNRETDTVTLLSEDAKHPHLFLWQTPETLPSDPKDLDATIPDILEFGAQRRTLEPILKEHSITTTRENISPPTLPTQPKRQTQINAFGFEYMGVPRKVEAVFADDKLTLVWILTGKGEEDRLRTALTEAYGQPVFVSDTIEAFNNWTVALRKDKPEVLAIAPELVPMMKAFFGG